MTPELNHNLRAIANRFPEVFEELKSAAHVRPSGESIEQFLARIYGSTQQDRLITRWISCAPANSFHVVVTTGIGNGSHLRALLQHMPASSRLCVIEAETTRLIEVLSQFDLQDLLLNARFILLTPFSYRDIVTRLNMELIGISSASRFIYTPIYETNPGLYQNMIETVMRQLTIRWNQLRTDITNAEVAFANSIKNLSQHKLGSEIMALQGIFKDKPLILVGAGPSLDESISFLKSAQNRAIIAVVNSAYRAVVKQGIVPDITIAVDPHEGTFRGYQGMDTSQPVLISTFLVYPEVPKLFPKRVFPLSSYNFLMTIIRRVLNLPEEPGIVGDGTVSSTVVNLAAFMGCNEIFLVGQDMAVKSDGQIHTKDSFYSDDNSNKIDTSKCRWIPGNHGELVPVEEKLFAYLRIFENQVSHYTHIKFYNLARTGSRIHGVPYLSSEQATEKIRFYEQQNFRQTLVQLAEHSKFPETTLHALDFLMQKYNSFLDTFIPALMKFAVSAEILAANQQSESKVLEWNDDLLEKRNQMLAQMKNNPLFTTLLGEGRTKKEYEDFITNGEPWTLVTNENAQPAELLPQVWALIEGSIFQKQLIEKYLSSDF